MIFSDDGNIYLDNKRDYDIAAEELQIFQKARISLIIREKSFL